MCKGAFRESLLLSLLLLGPFEDLVEFALAGWRGSEQGTVFFQVRRGAFLIHDFKALYIALPEEFYGVDEGVVEGVGLELWRKRV